MSQHPIRSADNFLIFGSPAIEQPEIDEVVACLKSGWIGTGPRVAQFESDFAAYNQASHAVAVNSCTAALHLSLVTLNLQPGDEVITSAFTFCASVNAIIHAGGTPVLVDIDPQTMNLDPERLADAITPKTRAVMPVHFAGRSCEMNAIVGLANQHDLTIIEDCAHAIETEYHGQKAGNFGDFGCFSFYVTKNVITGEGGMVTTKNEDDASRIKILALHGMSKDAWKRYSDDGFKHYQVVEAGFKYNMMDIQAAMGIHQLKRVEPYWRRRQAIWARYNEAFANLPITTPAPVEPNTRHAYHLYTILVDEATAGISRDAFMLAMKRENIGTGVHYMSVPEHPYYQEHFGWHPENYPHSMRIGRQIVSLPLSAKLSDGDVRDVISGVYKCLGADIE